MSAARFFVDTNVFLYRFDECAQDKQRMAADWIVALWTQGAGDISWQVIMEFYANAVRKSGVPTQTARAAVNDLLLWNPWQPSPAILHRAWHWVDAAQLSFWDGTILATAERAGCRYLLSEDFQSGRTYGDVTVVHPFQASPGMYFS